MIVKIIFYFGLVNKSYRSFNFIVIASIFVFTIFFIMKSENHKESFNHGSLVVGMSPDYPPFECIEKGEIVGFDIDFAHALGKIKNQKVDIKIMDFSSLIPALNSRKIDVIISSINKNSERLKSISFSMPYYASTFAIITNNKNHIKSIHDLKNCKIGVQTGSTMEKFINQYNHSIGNTVEIVSLSSNFLLLEKLKLEEVDGIIVEKMQAASFIKNQSAFKSILIKENVLIGAEENYYVVGLRKNTNLIKKVNEAIKILNTTCKIESLLKKWNLR